MQSIAESSRRPGLRSADTADYIERRTRTKFSEQCFSHVGPAAWNDLPDNIKLPGLTYLTTLSLPLMLTDLKIF